MQEQHTIELAPGLRIPAIGLGTWPLTGEEAADAVARALGNGYRHVDTAANYGNEQAVGAGIARTGVQRKTVWVTSKFNNEDLNRTGFNRGKEQGARSRAIGELLVQRWHALSRSRDGLTRGWAT
ncbi:aldo/keto reductase [Glutamicibacter protophormiae]|uniref:Diketogulonate reductase-like aldo/keto reductase n=1 Tax=Glutamicibacter protophormiae TaxID=37930 RepID=A0ABS4XTE7_GLUPR|nr:aldo/keto reductase [Glutamicibacter protophormiae]MBP2399764.1 diketogulonate reductase-like aldo/keto reductase [Glutamicibacter protophormiae]GGL89028.1 hypothetical protein GCM10010038_18750 [Glutamicibacter protophormiae]